MKRFSKAIGTLLGGVTGAGVVAAFAAFEVNLDPAVGGAIAVLLATLGTILAPANKDA